MSKPEARRKIALIMAMARSTTFPGEAAAALNVARKIAETHGVILPKLEH